jgi:hypothetical protein
MHFSAIRCVEITAFLIRFGQKRKPPGPSSFFWGSIPADFCQEFSLRNITAR